LTSFSSLTKSLLLLLLLSKDYYKSHFNSCCCIDTILMNRIVFAFNAISCNQRGMKRMERMERYIEISR